MEVRAAIRFRIIAGVGAVLAFSLSSWLMLRFLPGPHTPFDYMIVGTFATSIALLVLFLGLVSRNRGFFFGRRTR